MNPLADGPMASSNTDRTKLRQRRGAQVARAVITEAAAALFARKGYHGTTIEEIAVGAGYSPAAIYKYFRNKEDLFTSLWKSVADHLQSIFVQSAALELPFPLRLRWVVTMLAQMLERTPDLLIAYLAQRPHVVRGAVTELERQAAEHYRGYQRQVASFMEHGIEEGVLRVMPPEDLALIFMGLLQAFAYRWAMSEGNFDIPGNTALLFDLFLNGARRTEPGSGSARDAGSSPAPGR